MCAACFRWMADWALGREPPLEAVSPDPWQQIAARMPPTLFAFRLEGAPALVAKVYDGDTVHLGFEFGGEVVRCRCRLAGVDAPELHRDGDRAVAARDALAALTANARLRAWTSGADKYGRPLVRLALPDGRDVAQVLLAAGHVRPYSGGARGEW